MLNFREFTTSGKAKQIFIVLTAASKSRWKDCYKLTVLVVVESVTQNPEPRLRSSAREFYNTFGFNYITRFFANLNGFKGKFNRCKSLFLLAMKCHIKFGKFQ